MKKSRKEKSKSAQISRILGMYTKLMSGCVIYKAEEAQIHGMSLRSIQRDLDAINAYFGNDMVNADSFNSVDYDRKLKGYRLNQIFETKLTNSEILAVCKILLDSRALMKDEMERILKKLVSCCVPETNRKLIEDLYRNELFHYVELQHKTRFMDKMWDIGQAIRSYRYIEIDYKRSKDKKVVKRKVKPVAIMFSEYYFYVTAFIDSEEVRKGFEVPDDPFPTIYRMDRIKKLKVLEERFDAPYSSRFQEGEFRKRVQFMYGGKKQKVQFKYFGSDIEAVQDKLPTAEVRKEKEGEYMVEAEVFGKGIEMWMRSQGENVVRIDG